MVEPYNFKNNKQIKDALAGQRAVTGSVFLGFFLAMLFLGGTIGVGIGGKMGGLIGCLCGAVVSLIATRVWTFLADGISDNVGRMVYIGKKANWSLHESLQSDLQQIRYAKINERYDEALERVNKVLKKAPKWPEPLFLKAEILWEGYESLEESKEILKRIILMTEHPDQYHVWARAMYKKLSQIRQADS